MKEDKNEYIPVLKEEKYSLPSPRISSIIQKGKMV